MKLIQHSMMAAALSIATSTAMALPVEDLFFVGETNQLSDNSGESQGIDLNDNGRLDEGDTLRGTFDIQTIEALTGGGGTNFVGTNGNNELAGIFETEVISKTPSATIPGSFDYIFGPTASFEAIYGPGAVIAAFDDPSPDYDRSDTIAVGEATATDGNLVWTIGFAGDPDELWTASGPDNPDTIGPNTPLATILGGFNYQLSSLSESFATIDFAENALAAIPTGQAGANGLVDINGSGSILGTLGPSGPVSEYTIFDNIDLTVFPVAAQVPEPSSITLLGSALGLLGFAAYRRQRKSS